jgi:hypothetical protein
MTEHDTYHQQEDELRIKGHGVHANLTTRYPCQTCGGVGWFPQVGGRTPCPTCGVKPPVAQDGKDAIKPIANPFCPTCKSFIKDLHARAGESKTDFSTCLLNIEKSLSGLADVAESKSVTLGDKYGVLADGCIDAMESVQVLRNQINGIEHDEFQQEG